MAFGHQTRGTRMTLNDRVLVLQTRRNCNLEYQVNVLCVLSRTSVGIPYIKRVTVYIASFLLSFTPYTYCSPQHHYLNYNTHPNPPPLATEHSSRVYVLKLALLSSQLSSVSSPLLLSFESVPKLIPYSGVQHTSAADNRAPY